MTVAKLLIDTTSPISELTSGRGYVLSSNNLCSMQHFDKYEEQISDDRSSFEKLAEFLQPLIKKSLEFNRRTMNARYIAVSSSGNKPYQCARVNAIQSSCSLRLHYYCRPISITTNTLSSLGNYMGIITKFFRSSHSSLGNSMFLGLFLPRLLGDQFVHSLQTRNPLHEAAPDPIPPGFFERRYAVPL